MRTDPGAVSAAADTVAAAGVRLREHHDAVLSVARAATDGWAGAAAGALGPRLDRELGVLRAGGEACGIVVPALRALADQLRRAQADWDLGDQMLRAAAAAPVHEGAETGDAIMRSAESRAVLAGDEAAAAFARATALLPDVAAPPGPVVGADGTFGDGVWKGVGDVVDDLRSLVRGTWDHVNVFSEDWAGTWADSARTVAAIASDPPAAGRAVVEGMTEPIAESYRSGGTDEATGRAVPTIAGALAGAKGLTTLGHLVPDPPPTPVGGPLPTVVRPRTGFIPSGGLPPHEALGGHTLGKGHIGASPQDMLDRRARQSTPADISSYTSREVAEKAIHANLARNRSRIDEWLEAQPDATPKKFELRHHDEIGSLLPERARDVGDIIPVHSSRVVLRADPKAPGGYYLVTSYPTRWFP